MNEPGTRFARLKMRITVSPIRAALVAGLANTAVTGQPAPAGEAPPQRPNFVLVVVDDLGWMDLGCYGSKYYETPAIDHLAASGTRFTAAYAAAAVCW